MSQFYQKLALWLVFGLILVFTWSYFNTAAQPIQEISYSDFVEEVRQNQVREVRIQGEEITGVYVGGEGVDGQFKTYAPEDPELITFLRDSQVVIEVEPPEKNSYLVQFLLSWAPVMLLIGLWVFFMRQMQSGGSKALSFGKSRARLLSEQKKKATFSDVAGADEAKAELEEIIEFLKDPQRFQKLGGKIPKGVLLMGPPGTGKTLLARAIAGEANVPFFSISGSDFVEMFVGVGASRVRDLFEQGKKHAPCIVFIDEIDAVGRHRGAGLGGGHDEREQTLNQLLVEMDGFESNDGVILIAATNRPDVLDPALLRPGRFDRQVVVSRPDVRGRAGILTVHTKDIPLANDVDLAILARGTPGFSGADLSNLANEAALFAARQHKVQVDMRDFESAKDKVMMGAERRSMVISDEEKKVTAYHEAGHALVAKLLPGTDPIHKVTIIPRGMALGVTQQLPVEEKHAYPREYLVNNLHIYMGGRAAEELIFKDPTTGAGNDIERATELARKMVCEWGMSDRMGPLAFGVKEEQIFLGREIAQHKDYSEVTAIAIDEEVKRLVNNGYEGAKSILSTNVHVLHALAQALVEHEELNADEISALVEGCQGAASGNGTVPSISPSPNDSNPVS
ncbi:MAG: ATP-dependent zinc metalloprotease FtsH [Candidatus Tectomicrobia bacterium]|nr:ATP-dependent zinc metalloprotease FtsH [Candidatus Tectomicrobia bacterium]